MALRTRLHTIGCLILFLAAAAVSLPAPAAAAGWWRENVNDTINIVVGNGVPEQGITKGTSYDSYWFQVSGDASSLANSPHGRFSTTSNKCKACHAVHGAMSTSFRLLKNSSRAEECNYCHMGPAGASKYRLYALDDVGFTVQGEHTLGSTDIPDSSINPPVSNLGVGSLPDRGGPYDDAGRQALYCYACHSVHGANTIKNAGTNWTKKILRQDPAGNGGSADDGLQDINGSTFYKEDGESVSLATVLSENWSLSGGYDVPDEVKKAFCGDCHTKNYNFRLNIPDTGTDWFGNGPEEEGKDYSLTKGAHPMNDDGMLHVSGGAGANGVVEVSPTAFVLPWCGTCHTAGNSEQEYGSKAGGSVAGDPWGVTWTVVGFPHQSKGPKFFKAAYVVGELTRDATQTNDAYEPIPNTDGQVCLDCHGGKVGVTF